MHALEDADFELYDGEHVAVVGDNGAGKSTFVRQVTGVEQRTRGKIWFDGEEVHFKGPLDARQAGIETVFQNLALADDLDVPSNLFLGREKILFNLGQFSILDRRAMREATMEGLKRTGVKIPNLDNTIRHMSGGQRQCVAIARSATFASKLIIMDEPTAALGRAGDRAGRGDHQGAEGARHPDDPDQPQPAPGLRPRRPDRGVPPRPHRRHAEREGGRWQRGGRLHHRREGRRGQGPGRRPSPEAPRVVARGRRVPRQAE